jgi:hypothetical protein
MGRLTTGVISCGVEPSDVPARPAFANSVILAAGPRILEARSRTKNSLVIQAEIASLGCRHTAGNDDGGILDRGIERGRHLLARTGAINPKYPVTAMR